MYRDEPVSVSDSDVTFASVRASLAEDHELAASLQAANVILLPMFDSERDGQPVFGTAVREVYRALAEGQEEGLVVELAYEGDSPPLLVLHGDLIVLGTLLISHVVLPTVVGILGNIIYERVRQGSQELDSSEVRCSLLIEDSDGTSRRLDYKGPASTFEKAVLERTLPRPPDGDESSQL